jgi:pSer/pThr/pTyr-binding forkhead associated (FHA) protein
MRMRVKLLELPVVEGQHREIAITKEEFLIGRGSDCDLRLGVSAVSRHHCLIRCRGGEVTLADLGSANGTFVNGQRIRSQTVLRHGDDIALGEFQFKVELEGMSGIDWGPEAAAPPDATTCRVTAPKRPD